MRRGVFSAARLAGVFHRGSAGQALQTQARWASTAETPWPSPQMVELNYQLPPPPGKRTGRYIGDQEDKGDTVDENDPRMTKMYDGRQESPGDLESCGFELASCPTKVVDFRNDEEVTSVYYEEMRQLVKKQSGADRVFIFDHTVRSSAATSLNALQAGATAAAVPRVHCDYTAVGAPVRLKQLGEQGINSLIRGRNLSEEEVDMLAAGRFAFINVWRGINETPIYRKPLAMADTRTVPTEDFFTYELIFPDRIGQNYSLKFSEEHKWYYYPEMKKDECLVFKVYDKHEDGPRFVFHTAFDDPMCPEDAPPRESIEVRAIAFFDCPGGPGGKPDLPEY